MGGGAGGADGCARGRVGFAATITAFLLLNSSLNMMNRWVLGVYGFRYPILLTLCHLSFGFAVLAPLMALPRYRALHRPTLERQWKGVAAVGTFKVVNIVLNNMSLVFITLSLNQVIRSAIPVITALTGVLIEGKVPTRAELASLCMLSAGVMLSVWEGSVGGSVQGIVIAMLSTLSGAAMLNFSGAVLSEKLDVLRLTFYTAPVSVGVLLPFFFMQEAGRVREYAADHSAVVVLYILAGGVNAVAYNVVHYLTIQVTSAVTTPVIGMVKVVGLVLLSALVLGERDLLTPRMAAGCGLALAGFCWYSAERARGAGSRPGTPGRGAGRVAGYARVAPGAADAEAAPRYEGAAR